MDKRSNYDCEITGLFFVYVSGLTGIALGGLKYEAKSKNVEKSIFRFESNNCQMSNLRIFGLEKRSGPHPRINGSSGI